ncbi:MAG: hypothetical protein HY747_05145 [Elusimicrobia bacterium]|nr:hypothetical protein [Elusimicrobiota bacterium]
MPVWDLVFSMLKEIVVSPSDFFKRIEQGQNLWAFCLGIYSASIIAAGLFYTFKPPGFPSDSVSADAGGHSFWFWLAMGLAGGVMTLAIGACLCLLLRFIEGKFKISLSQTMFVLLASHIWYLILSVFLAGACYFKSAQFYKMSELVFSLAGFIFTIAGIKKTAKTTVPRVFVSLLVSSLGLVCGLFSLYLIGLLPNEILKVLLFI